MKSFSNTLLQPEDERTKQSFAFHLNAINHTFNTLVSHWRLSTQ